MAEAVGAVLVYAVGVGISPLPIIAVILVLFSRRSSVNGPLFAAGWVVGLAVLITVLYGLARAVGLAAGSGARDGVAWIKVVLGAGLVVLALRGWWARPRAGEPATLPGWMDRVEEIRPVGAAGLALVLAANPKNLLLGFGAATSLAEANPDPIQAAVGLGLFVLVGSLAVLAAVGFRVVGGARAEAGLDRARDWLGRHHEVVMAGIFGVFGVVLVAQGLTGH